MVNDTPWCVRFSHSSYIGKLSGIVGGPGEGGASGVWCCGACVVRLTPAMLLVPSSLFLHQLNYRCEILIPVSQTHIHYHKVPLIQCGHYVVQTVNL